MPPHLATTYEWHQWNMNAFYHKTDVKAKCGFLLRFAFIHWTGQRNMPKGGCIVVYREESKGSDGAFRFYADVQ